MRNLEKLLISLLLLMGIMALSSCGGGGGGGTPTLAPPPANQQNLDTGGDTTPTPPSEDTTPEVSVPDVAKSAGEIGGVLADAEGSPVGDLEVYLDSVDNVVSSTDENGQFIIAGVSAGDHTVLFGLEGEEVVSFPVAGFDDSAPLNAAFTAQGVKASSALGDPGSLRGRVTEPNGEPIPGVRVLVFDREGFFVMRRTNENGVYEFGHLPPGEYWLLGFKRGYRTHVGRVGIESGQTTIHDFTMFPIPVGGVEGIVTDEEENPLPGTHVFLLYREGDRERPPAFHTVTNHEGYYRFEPVPTGAADMLAFHPGYIPGDAEVEIVENQMIEQNFVLRPIGPPPPPPPASLDGRVFGPEERPIPGAVIVLERFDGERWETRSGEEGGYEFFELTAGPYHYKVSKEGFQDNSGSLMLAPGENHRNFFLHPLRQGGVIEGRILIERADDPEHPGHPVPGAEVKLFRGEPGENNRPLRVTESNERGEYRFGELPPSGDVPYVVVAHKMIEGQMWGGMEDTHLRENEVVQLDVWLRPVGEPEGGTIFGMVWRPHPENPDHEWPVSGAWVKLYHGEPDPSRPPLRVTETNDRGMYAFDNLPPSGDRPYVLIAGKEFDDGMWMGDGATHLGAGEEKRVDIQLFPQTPPPEFGFVWGKVWRAIEGHEELVPGALVLLFHGAPGEGNAPIRETHSNENGVYEFGEVPPSGDLPYVVVAKKEFDNGIWHGAEDFHLGPGEEKQVNIQLMPPEPPPEFGSVAGKVWREIEGNEEVVPGALVLLFHGAPGEDNPPIRETHTNVYGRYGFYELPPSGDLPYVVVAKKEFDNGIWHGMEDFHLGPGEHKEVNIRIFPPEPPPENGSVEGIVWRMIEGNEEHVAGALVLLFHGEPGPDNPPLQETHSDENGHYAFDGLAPSGEVPYFVVAKKEYDNGLWQGMKHFWLAPGENKEVHVQIFPPEG